MTADTLQKCTEISMENVIVIPSSTSNLLHEQQLVNILTNKTTQAKLETNTVLFTEVFLKTKIKANSSPCYVNVTVYTILTS